LKSSLKRYLLFVAVAALTEPGHEEKLHELTGPQAFTHAERAEHLSRRWDAMRRSSTSHPRPCATLFSASGSQTDKRRAPLKTYAHYRRGEVAAVTSRVRDAIGKAPRTYDDSFIRYKYFSMGFVKSALQVIVGGRLLRFWNTDRERLAKRRGSLNLRGLLATSKDQFFR
jgi:hypothetical protein